MYAQQTGIIKTEQKKVFITFFEITKKKAPKSFIFRFQKKKAPKKAAVFFLRSRCFFFVIFLFLVFSLTNRKITNPLAH